MRDEYDFTKFPKGVRGKYVKKEICSKCHEDFMNCRCDTYHPNIPIPEYTWACKKCKIEFTLNYKPRFCLWCGAPVKDK